MEISIADFYLSKSLRNIIAEFSAERKKLMAIRVFEVRNAENEVVMVLQGKQKRAMESAVADYIRCGRLPYGEYTVECVRKERN